MCVWGSADGLGDKTGPLKQITLYYIIILNLKVIHRYRYLVICCEVTSTIWGMLFSIFQYEQCDKKGC